jgi:two-component system alkaline phosphatase synthesis response regulator PhoP
LYGYNYEKSKEVFSMIYCVEDEKAILDLMVYTLKASGFEAQGFESDAGFWLAMKDKKPELVILDVMLPGEDGLSILKRLRESPVTADIPVIMATAKDSEFDKVIGLDSGADDYLAKPFGMLEMVSRIKAVLRRTSPKQPSILVCGDISLDESKHTVTVFDRPVLLTLKEYELLKLFMENPGRVFTRDILLAGVWGQDFLGETRTVDVHIGTLRTKLAEAGDLIHTVRGVGYKMEENHES